MEKRALLANNARILLHIAVCVLCGVYVEYTLGIVHSNKPRM